MTPGDETRFYGILGLPHDACLDELDERYLQLTLHLSGPHGLQDKEEARSRQELVDEAYDRLLARFFQSEDKVREPLHDPFTMKQVANAQDRIQMPSQTDDDMWMPPRGSRSHQHLFDIESNAIDKGQIDGGSQAPGFSLEWIEGDIFDAPDRAVIVHAVNCLGVWGSGIAAQLREAFPGAYKFYRAYCRQASKPADLIGGALLIPPQLEDYTDTQSKVTGDDVPTLFQKRRWIACLFTSIGYGKPNKATGNPGKDSPEGILACTRIALEHLRVLLEDFGPSNFDEETNWQTDDDKPGDIWCCKFNSGAFGVDWNDTCDILEEEFAGFERPWTVVTKVGKWD